MVNSKLAQIVAAVFEIDPSEVSVDSGSDAIEKWDSLGHIEFILQIEEAFGVEFSMERIPELVTVDAIQKELEKAKVI